MLAISEELIDAPALLKAFEEGADGAGAIVSFSGIVRPEASNGAVENLFLQAHSPMTENGISAAIDDAKSRWPITSVFVQHRVGEMKSGETIVFVAITSKSNRNTKAATIVPIVIAESITGINR